MADFTLTDCGSIVTIRPETEAAREWCSAHLPDDAMWFGGAVAIEPRYAGDIVDGILGDGLEVE